MKGVDSSDMVDKGQYQSSESNTVEKTSKCLCLSRGRKAAETANNKTLLQ